MNAMFSPLPTVRRVHDALATGPQTKGELRQALGLPRMAADRAIFELQTRGIVERHMLVRTCGNRRRAMTWKLTAEGRALIERRMRLDP